jgi:hypothetical protein
MGSKKPMPTALIPINQKWVAANHPNGEPLDISVIQYPYWTKISILRINQLNNDEINFPEQDGLV